MENVNKCKNNGKQKNIKKDGKIENIAKWPSCDLPFEEQRG